MPFNNQTTLDRPDWIIDIPSDLTFDEDINTINSKSKENTGVGTKALAFCLALPVAGYFSVVAQEGALKLLTAAGAGELTGSLVSYAAALASFSANLALTYLTSEDWIASLRQLCKTEKISNQEKTTFVVALLSTLGTIGLTIENVAHRSLFVKAGLIPFTVLNRYVIYKFGLEKSILKIRSYFKKPDEAEVAAVKAFITRSNNQLKKHKNEQEDALKRIKDSFENNTLSLQSFRDHLLLKNPHTGKEFSQEELTIILRIRPRIFNVEDSQFLHEHTFPNILYTELLQYLINHNILKHPTKNRLLNHNEIADLRLVQKAPVETYTDEEIEALARGYVYSSSYTKLFEGIALLSGIAASGYVLPNIFPLKKWAEKYLHENIISYCGASIFNLLGVVLAMYATRNVMISALHGSFSHANTKTAGFADAFSFSSDRLTRKQKIAYLLGAIYSIMSAGLSSFGSAFSAFLEFPGGKDAHGDPNLGVAFAIGGLGAFLINLFATLGVIKSFLNWSTQKEEAFSKRLYASFKKMLTSSTERSEPLLTPEANPQLIHATAQRLADSASARELTALFARNDRTVRSTNATAAHTQTPRRARAASAFQEF